MARRAEIVTTLVWFCLGATIAVASWRMDRLGHLAINPWSAPGLTPGAIGVAMMVFALALGVQAWRAQSGSDVDAPHDSSARRTLVAGMLCVLFAGATLGRGVPFVVAGAAFAFLFTTIFSWATWRAEGRVGRGLALTLLVAVAACAVISWLFESVFLVRLP